MQDERGPGLDFSFVCGSCPWGAAALLLCLFICIIKFFKCSPVPAFFFPFYELCYIGAETRKEGGTCCQKKPSLLRGIAVLRRSGSTEKWRPPVAARGGGARAIEDQVGRKARCRAPGSRRGGCRPRGSGGVGAVRQEAGACCRPPCWGRSRERGGAGNGDSLPAALKPEEPSPSARRRSVEPSTKGCPVPSYGTASESLAAGWGPSGSVSGNRTENF